MATVSSVARQSPEECAAWRPNRILGTPGGMVGAFSRALRAAWMQPRVFVLSNDASRINNGHSGRFKFPATYKHVEQRAWPVLKNRTIQGAPPKKQMDSLFGGRSNAGFSPPAIYKKGMLRSQV